MRILIYDINYFPELTGVGKYTGEMGSWLVQKGHEVEVITAMPYYPEWRIHKEYRKRGWFKEHIEGVTVYRCPLYVPHYVTSLKRVIHELSFQLSSLPYWFYLAFGKSFDVLICITPPFHSGFLPVVFSRFSKTPLWLHLQDLQIDIAKELGMLNGDKFLNMLYAMENFILSKSTIVSTISTGMINKIADKSIQSNEITFFPNWVDGDYIKPLPIEQSLRSVFGIKNSDKVILYSGSLGEKQGLELIIKAAHYFSSYPDIKFLIIGSGGGKNRLEQLAHNYHLKNVYFHPLQPYEKLSALLATADLHLVLQKKSASDLVLPSKLTSILAAGGCALVAALPGTTLYEVIDTHQMGILIEPESIDALIKGISKAFELDLVYYQQNARRYAQEYLNKDKVLSQFEAKLMQISKKKAPS